MLSEDKKRALAILQSHDDQYTVACVKELHQTMSIPLQDMQHLRICLELAQDYP